MQADGSQSAAREVSRPLRAVALSVGGHVLLLLIAWMAWARTGHDASLPMHLPGKVAMVVMLGESSRSPAVPTPQRPAEMDPLAPPNASAPPSSHPASVAPAHPQADDEHEMPPAGARQAVPTPSPQAIPDTTIARADGQQPAFAAPLADDDPYAAMRRERALAEQAYQQKQRAQLAGTQQTISPSPLPATVVDAGILAPTPWPASVFNPFDIQDPDARPIAWVYVFAWRCTPRLDLAFDAKFLDDQTVCDAMPSPQVSADPPGQ